MIHEEFGILEGLMTTVHATTGFHLSVCLSFLYENFVRDSRLIMGFMHSNTEDC